jgi:hypothetical protein
MDLDDAVEQDMVKDAERMIDRMIPPGGLSTFNDPELQSLLGLGAVDLDAAGSAAFGQSDLDRGGSNAFLGEMDLDRGGSNAFLGEIDLDRGGSNAFLGEMDLDTEGSGAFGKLKISGAMKRIGRVLLRKKRAAKDKLKKVGVAHNQAANVAKKAFQMSKFTINPFHKAKLAKQAKRAAKRANALMKQGKALAKEVVAPTITREEAKAAVLPAVKTLAKGVSASGKSVIKMRARALRPWGSRKDVQEYGFNPFGKRPPAIPTAVRESSPQWVKQASKKLMAMKISDAIKGQGGAVKGFLGMGDMDTVTQAPESGDILDTWDSSEMFEDALLF